MFVFQCVGKIPNKLRGRVKNQHCPTHRVCTGQHVIGCYWQHLGSTGLEPGLLSNSTKGAHSISCNRLTTELPESFQRNYIYIYMYIYSAETFCASKSFVSAALQRHQGAATDTLGVSAIVPPTISCPSNTPKTQSRKPRDPKCYSMNPHEEQKTLW